MSNISWPGIIKLAKLTPCGFKLFPAVPAQARSIHAGSAVAECVESRYFRTVAAKDASMLSHLKTTLFVIRDLPSARALGSSTLAVRRWLRWKLQLFHADLGLGVGQTVSTREAKLTHLPL